MAAPQKFDIPRATWEPIFFGAIDSLSKTAGWTRLRQANLANGALEIRVWVGFGLTPLEGFRLLREGSRWTAYHVKEGFGDKQPLEHREMKPQGGWDALWRKIEALGILTLPDSSSLPDEAMVFDGVSYVVEISDGRSYRTYQYGNPQYQKWPEAKKSTAIVTALYEELVPKRNRPNKAPKPPSWLTFDVG
jgi:hypothetical protein